MEPRALGAFDFPKGFPPPASPLLLRTAVQASKLGQHFVLPAAALTAFGFPCQHSQVRLENVTKQEATGERRETREGRREEAGEERRKEKKNKN